jgi:hypothetical protein
MEQREIQLMNSMAINIEKFGRMPDDSNVLEYFKTSEFYNIPNVKG